MTDISQIAKSICNAVTKAQCIWEWDNVNDPPCHPSDEDWKGCSSCYANREILAVAFLAAANHLRPRLSRTPWIGPNDKEPYFNETFENYEALGELTIVEQLLQIAKHLESCDPDELPSVAPAIRPVRAAKTNKTKREQIP